MGIKEKLSEDMKTALKAKDQKRLNVVRMLLSEIKYAQAAVSMQKELPEEECQKAVQGYAKKLTKSLGDFPAGEKRDEILQEIKIVESYLPSKLTPEQVETAIHEVLKEESAGSELAFGPTMKKVMERLGPGADGRMVSEKLKLQLQK